MGYVFLSRIAVKINGKGGKWVAKVTILKNSCLFIYFQNIDDFAKR